LQDQNREATLIRNGVVVLSVLWTGLSMGCLIHFKGPSNPIPGIPDRKAFEQALVDDRAVTESRKSQILHGYKQVFPEMTMQEVSARMGLPDFQERIYNTKDFGPFPFRGWAWRYQLEPLEPGRPFRDGTDHIRLYFAPDGRISWSQFGYRVNACTNHERQSPNAGHPLDSIRNTNHSL
jgi:hypothetical protein